MTQTREALIRRAAELRDLNARLHGGEVPSMDVLRRAWTLAAPRSGLPALPMADVPAQIARTVNAWAGRETVRLLCVVLQGGAVCGWGILRPWAEADQCASLAGQLTQGTTADGGPRTLLLCLHVWDGQDERPPRGVDAGDFAFTQAAGAWSGFTLG